VTELCEQRARSVEDPDDARALAALATLLPGRERVFVLMLGGGHAHAQRAALAWLGQHGSPDAAAAIRRELQMTLRSLEREAQAALAEITRRHPIAEGGQLSVADEGDAGAVSIAARQKQGQTT
jgi:hypothetical protein